MQNPILLASMIIIGVIAGAIMGIIVTILWHNWRSRQFRSRYEIPNIIGKWRCEWFDDAIDSDKPKVEDTVEIEKWTANGEFLARGYQPQFNLSYPIIGDIDPSRVVTLIYKAARYPYEPNRGIICMELSRDEKSMEGRWFGRRFSGEISGGRVRCARIPNTAAV